MVDGEIEKSILISLFLTPLMISLVIVMAPRIGLLDIPNQRSSHSDPIPKGAGIGMIAALLCSAAFDTQHFIDYRWIFLSIAIIWIGGIWDDLTHSSPKTKFLFIIVATLMIIYQGLLIDDLGVCLHTPLKLPKFVAVAFTLFAVSGFTNGFNLIDGLDGLSSLIGIIILSAFAYIGYLHHDFLILYLSGLTIVALTLFLFFNWHPAKIFLGDSGSLAIGFIISIIAIRALEYIQPVKILYLAAIPILDTLIVMLRRKIRGLSTFYADKTHLHHIALRYFDNNVQKAVLLLSTIQLLFTIVGFTQFDQREQFLALGLYGILYLLFFVISTRMLKRQEESVPLQTA